MNTRGMTAVSVVMLWLLAGVCAAQTKAAGDGRNPHAPTVKADPRLSGPYGPVFRWAATFPSMAVGDHHLVVGDPTAADGYLASIVTTSGGDFVFSACRDDRSAEDLNRKDRNGYAVYVAGKHVPMVVRMSADGAVVWQRELQKKGFLDFEAGDVAVRRDGNVIAYVPSYVKPSSDPVGRFFLLDGRTGKTIWEKQLRGTGGLDSPVVDSARLDDRGDLLLDGRVSLLAHDDETRDWLGEISSDGRTTLDRTGPITPPPGEGAIPFDLVYARQEAWLQNAAAGGGDAELPFYRWAWTNRLALAGVRWSKPASQGWMTPVVPRTGGGFVGVGVKDQRDGPRGTSLPWKAGNGIPEAVAMDGKGGILWERPLGADGFDAWAGGLALEASDGSGRVLVMIPSYRLRSFDFAPRFVLLSADGAVLWEKSFPVNPKTGRAPEFERARWTDRGTLAITGHAYADAAFQQIRDWDGELDLAGRIVLDRTGGPWKRPGEMTVIDGSKP